MILWCIFFFVFSTSHIQFSHASVSFSMVQAKVFESMIYVYDGERSTVLISGARQFMINAIYWGPSPSRNWTSDLISKMFEL